MGISAVERPTNQDLEEVRFGRKIRSRRGPFKILVVDLAGGDSPQSVKAIQTRHPMFQRINNSVKFVRATIAWDSNL